MAVRVVNGIAITKSNRFSKFVKSPSELDGWKAHFDQAGVPCVIVLTRHGYALYREDMVSVIDDLD